MLKRLGFGLLKGLLVGAGLGAAIQVGLGWGDTSGLLGYLLAMAVGATAGTICGKPPWRAASLIESILKAVFGVGVGALLYWVGSTYLPFPVPFAMPNAEVGAAWSAQPILYAPLIAMIFGMIVELDNTEPGNKSSKSGRKKSGGGGRRRTAARTRVAIGDEVGDEFDLPGGASTEKKA